MSESSKKILPDYHKVDGLTVASSFCPYAVREAFNLKPSPGDVFLTTFPKNGTTWTQQIIHLIKNGGKRPESASESFQTIPFLELMGTEVIDKIPGDPRVMKVHMPFDRIPYSPHAKYIVVVRNPKDTLVSFYHHTNSLIYGFQGGEFNDYFDLFMNGDNDFGDYFDSVMSWYHHRYDNNVLYLYYEKMKKDHRGSVVEIAKFLGTKYEEMVKDQQILDDIVKYSGIEYMSKEEVNFADPDFFKVDETEVDSLPVPKHVKCFLKYIITNRKTRDNDLFLVRKGEVGGWRKAFSPEQNRRMNEKIEARLKGTELLEFWTIIDCI